MQRLPFAFALVALLACASTPAQTARQNASEVADMCANTRCQRNVRVTLTDKSGATFDRTFETFPAVVQPLGIVVLAGQTVYIEADVVDGKLTNLVAVGRVRDPGKTITATFEQADGKDMLLTVMNPFPKNLKFNMGLMLLDQERLVKTSSCPIGPGLKSFEHWPYPIFQVVLARGHLLAEDSKLACVD